MSYVKFKSDRLNLRRESQSETDDTRKMNRRKENLNEGEHLFAWSSESRKHLPDYATPGRTHKGTAEAGTTGTAFGADGKGDNVGPPTSLESVDRECRQHRVSPSRFEEACGNELSRISGVYIKYNMFF